MAKTTTRQQQPRQQTAAPPPLKEESSENIPAVLAPRLAYHPAIETRFGIDKSAWKVLVESTWPSARTPDSVILALSYCKARNLDPFKRPVHIVPITVKKLINGVEKFVEIETVWPAISETRTTAFRTKDYAGMDQPDFGPTKTFNLIDSRKEGNGYVEFETTIDAPEWCQITVHRVVDGLPRPFPGPRVYFAEFYAPKNRFVTAPNEQWRRKPSYMLEKCAEATALRRAFPEEYGDKYAIEELGSLGHLRTIGGEATFGAADKPAADPAKPRPEPNRRDFQPARAAAAGAQEEPPPPTTDPRGEGGASAQDDGDHRNKGAQDDGGDRREDSAKSEHRVPDDVLGQDSIIKWIEAAVDKAGDADTLDAIELQNADKIAKIGDLKRSALNKRIEDKRSSLGSAGS